MFNDPVNNRFSAGFFIPTSLTIITEQLERMVRVIRNVKTGDYFKKGKWTPNFDEAQKFKGAPEILKLCAALKLEDVEMVIRVDPARPDLRVPLPNP